MPTGDPPTGCPCCCHGPKTWGDGNDISVADRAWHDGFGAAYNIISSNKASRRLLIEAAIKLSKEVPLLTFDEICERLDAMSHEPNRIEISGDVLRPSIAPRQDTGNKEE